MSNASQQKKTSIVMLSFFFVLFLAALVIWGSFRPRALNSVKKISVTITHTDGSVRKENIETTEMTLRAALEEIGLIYVMDGESGSFIATVDDQYIGPGTSGYWVFLVNGGYSDYDINTQPIADGDVYSFYVNVKW